MDRDIHFLETMKEGDSPILHIYGFKRPAFTYGVFQKPETLIAPGALLELDHARRPTGGGLVFHLWDVTFSLVIARGHPLYIENAVENYRLIHEKLIAELPPGAGMLSEASGRDSFCFVKPTIYDVMWGGKKIGGAAQRRRRHALLHQASFSVEPFDPPFLEKVLLHPDDVLPKMGASTAFLGKCLSREELIQCIVRTFIPNAKK